MEKIKADCIVIGGGVAGLSIARKISHDIKDIFLIEKEQFIGNEISSRNSEVIHAGIYYKPDSLKNKLILKGKKLLYEYLEAKKIPYNRCGKYIVASTKEEIKRINAIKNNAEKSGLDDLYFDTINFKKLYPFIKTEEAIFSPSTGIFDSHSFMLNLKMDFERNGGHILLNNELLEINHCDNLLQLLIYDKNLKMNYIVETKMVYNCAGLSSIKIYDMFPGNQSIYIDRYVKGEYYNYHGKEMINNLIYPIPTKDSLGIHVTLDMGRGIRFGPSAFEINSIDYKIEEKNKYNFVNNIKKYWPEIDESMLEPSYAGIRPKIKGFDDYQIINSQINDSKMFSILGYESPGLTASLGLADYIHDLMKEI